MSDILDNDKNQTKEKKVNRKIKLKKNITSDKSKESNKTSIEDDPIIKKMESVSDDTKKTNKTTESSKTKKTSKPEKPKSNKTNDKKSKKELEDELLMKYDDKKTKKTDKNSSNYIEDDIGSFEGDEKKKLKSKSKSKKNKFKLIKQKLNLEEIIVMSYPQIISMAKEMNIAQVTRYTHQELISKILKAHISLGGSIYAKGVLDIVNDFGFLRYSCYSYFESSNDVYVAPSQIRSLGMKKGDTVAGYLRLPNDNGNYFALVHVESINGKDPSKVRTRIGFEKLIPIYPDKKIKLEYAKEKYATRILDIFAPIGTGQRGLIVAPPKAGKTIILQEVANSIAENHPDYKVVILLIDERPEEVTDMKENVPNAEVIASTFDEQPIRHTKIAEIVIEKVKRLVEQGENVVILLDSITRLARAYNLTVQTSGKVLSGGVDANALYGPKKFFGAARNIRGGGSLTIIATALIETGSKMDEVIFEEFKGTGNMEVTLLRKLADRRIFPAIDIVRSSTRKEELLLNPETKAKSWLLRKVLADMDEVSSMRKVMEKMKKSKKNQEFLNMLQG